MKAAFAVALFLAGFSGCQPKPPEPATPGPETFLRQQQACEKSGGRWGEGQTPGFYLCYRTTRDAGKSCKRKSDCQGQCLAPSQSCAPFTPLLGCYDVLNSAGIRESACLD